MKLIVCLVLVVLVLDNAIAEMDKKNYCTKLQVARVMRTACRGRDPSIQKRNFFYTKSNEFSKSDQYILWRRLFNLGDNATVTIPEASLQLSLLFGRCNDYQKQADLKSLLELYKNREYQSLNRYTNDRSNGFPNYDAGSDGLALMRYRRELTFTDECCSNPCDFPKIQQYCPSNRD